MRDALSVADGADDVIIVCGSFYLAAEARAWIIKHERNEALL